MYKALLLLSFFKKFVKLKLFETVVKITFHYHELYRTVLVTGLETTDWKQNCRARLDYNFLSALSIGAIIEIRLRKRIGRDSSNWHIGVGSNS